MKETDKYGCVCVCAGFVICGCFGNTCTYIYCVLYCLYCVFVVFRLCIVLYCGSVPAANVPGRTAAEGLLYKPWSLVFPTCTARCLH